MANIPNLKDISQCGRIKKLAFHINKKITKLNKDDFQNKHFKAMKINEGIH